MGDGGWGRGDGGGGMGRGGYFLMGRIFKKLEMPNRAMLNFSLALDLKPSSADVNSIKAAIEKLHVPEEEEEEEL